MNGPSLADIEKARDIARETPQPKWLLLAVRPENTQIAKENFFCVPLPEVIK